MQEWDMPHATAFRGSVLLYGRDENLLRTRQSLLRAAGYRVTSIATTEQFQTILPRISSFGILVLCHTINDTERTIYEKQIHSIDPDISIYSMEVGTMPEEFLKAIANCV